MEAISSELLDKIEAFLGQRVGVDVDGKLNEATHILMELQNERHADPEEDDRP